LRALETSQHDREDGKAEETTGNDEEFPLPEARIEEGERQLSGTEGEDAEDCAEAKGHEEELRPVFNRVLWGAGKAREEFAVHDHRFLPPLLHQRENLPLEDEGYEGLEWYGGFPLDDGSLLIDFEGDFDGLLWREDGGHEASILLVLPRRKCGADAFDGCLFP